MNGKNDLQNMQLASELLTKLNRIESVLEQLLQQRIVKEFYTTAEVAEILDRAEWTVREWCRLARVNAKKRLCGRGTSQEWIISHAELERIRNEGLLRDPRITKKPWL